MRLLGVDRFRRRYWRLQPAVQRRLKIAVPYFLAGVIVLTIVLAFGEAPYWPSWALFTALFVLLEWFSVEVNDKLFHSSSIMVV
ncbi:MAG TPA: hypothetical protein VI141_05080, partial [Acidimicrobiia bacterium]